MVPIHDTGVSNLYSRSDGSPSTPRETKILPPLSKIRHGNNPTRSLNPSPPPQYAEEPTPTHVSQSGTRKVKEHPQAEPWSAKRLRCRKSQVRHEQATLAPVTTLLDSIDGSDTTMAVEKPGDEGEYDVEWIDRKRLVPRLHEYWIKWVGYNAPDWIPSADCFRPDLINELRAAQDADLVAARLAGRVEEIRMLVTIGDNAQARANGNANTRTGLLGGGSQGTRGVISSKGSERNTYLTGPRT